MVENELVTGSLASRERALARFQGEVGMSGNSTAGEFERGKGRGHEKMGSEGGRLYAEFMRGGGGVVREGGEGVGLANGFANGEGRIEEVVTPWDERGGGELR